MPWIAFLFVLKIKTGKRFGWRKYSNDCKTHIWVWSNVWSVSLSRFLTQSRLPLPQAAAQTLKKRVIEYLEEWTTKYPSQIRLQTTLRYIEQVFWSKPSTHSDTQVSITKKLFCCSYSQSNINSTNSKRIFRHFKAFNPSEIIPSPEVSFICTCLSKPQNTDQFRITFTYGK